LDIGRQHGRRIVLLRHTHKLERRPCPICTSRSGNVRLFLWEQRVDDWFDTSVDESLEDFKRDSQKSYGTIALWVPQWLLWLRDRNY